MVASMLIQPDIDSRDLTSIELLFCGGSIVHPELVAQMNTHVPNGIVMVAYGASEFNGVITMNYPKPVPLSVGRLACGAQMRIVDIDGKRCGPNEDGEIYAKPLFPFLGYYNRPDETKNIQREDGFICSGDIGRFDEDGNLYVVGRMKEIFKYKTMQITPSELENIILALKGVENVCVFGMPDFECGELPAAMVVKSENSDISEADIHNTINGIQDIY